MITIYQEKCIACGSCETVCHTGSIKLMDGRVTIDNTICSTCAQCIAVCPCNALALDGITGKRIDHDLLPDASQIKEFLKQRKSIRKFKQEPIERTKLEEIAVMSKYSPTNNYQIDAIIIDDRLLINELEEICINFVDKTYKRFYRNKTIFNIMSKLTPMMNVTDKIKIERTLIRGNIFQNAPALIILYADCRIVYTKESAQYALYNMILYAQSIGIGTCISGAGTRILARNKAAKKILNIPRDKEIVGMIFLGYPDVKFLNKAEGIKPDIKWNSEG